MVTAAFAAGRSQAGCRHGACGIGKHTASNPPVSLHQKLDGSCRRSSRRPERTRTNFIGCPLRTSCRSASPTGQKNEIAPVVCRSFVSSLPRATVTGCLRKAKAASRVALLVWRNGVRTFVAIPRGRMSLSFFIGALAAAPGSIMMRRASPAVLPSHEQHGFERVALPLHFLLNAHAIARSNLRLP